MHGVAAGKRRAAVARAIRRTNLADKATQPIQTLSRGYRQRVGVAQALLHDPALIILDEPTNGLDPTQILQMRSLIAELASSATVILSTHILQEVQAVCERVLILRGGKLVVDSRLDELQQGGRLLVAVDSEAGDKLKGLPKVARVEPLGEENGHYRYALEAPAESAPEVVEQLCREGVRIYSLQQERRDLETLFAQVNAVEGGEVAHG